MPGGDKVRELVRDYNVRQTEVMQKDLTSALPEKAKAMRAALDAWRSK